MNARWGGGSDYLSWARTLDEWADGTRTGPLELPSLAPDDLPITVVADGGGHHRFTLGELLPKPFRMEPERS